MFSKLKRILHPENMLFKMIILNCGLLLLVTLVLTAAGNYIYEEIYCRKILCKHNGNPESGVEIA